MKEKKVAVLMSTYNGEKYLKEQIESILNQTYKNIEIIVRDDGSKDKTIDILKEYSKVGKIQLIEGENIGFVNSFLELLKNAYADYYSFADQDDIWNENKIELAVNMLEKEDPNIPVMYYSDYYLLIQKKKKIVETKKRCKYLYFANSVCECVNLGMTTVINNKAKILATSKIPRKGYCCGHDWWIYTVCSAFGKVIYDPTKTVKHRAHENNASGCGDSFVRNIIKRIKTIKDNHFVQVEREIQEFSDCFYNKLSCDNKKIIDLFDNRKKVKHKYIKKLFYKQRFHNVLSEEIIFRTGILFGLI